MCRSIRSLHNYDPPTTGDDIRAAALQYVRKVSGMTRPAAANAEAFERAVESVAAATHELLGSLVTATAPKSRALEIERARARSIARFAPAAPGGSD